MDEEAIISLIWADSRRNKGDAFSDDVAWVKNKAGYIVVKTEMLTSGTDVPVQMTPEQIGSKALVSAISDYASKAVQPLYYSISLAIPSALDNRGYLSSLFKGFHKTARKYGLELLSGDTNSSDGELVIDVSLLGFAKSIVKRSGARPGDMVGVSGDFGLESAGLAILLGKASSKDTKFAKRATSSVLEPRANLALDLALGKYLTAATDSSDGLSLSLYHIAESSGVGIDIDQVPMPRGLKEFSIENKLEAEELALFGGEEYELVVTYSPKHAKKVESFGIKPIGKVASKSRQVYLRKNKLERRGWVHLGRNSLFHK